MRRFATSVVSTFFIFILLSCDNSSDPLVCTGEAEPAIVVEIIDRTTGRYIARDAKGVIRDGTYSDSLRHFDGTQTNPELIIRTLAAGFERSGTYDINIQLEGYQPFGRENISVPAGDCGPETQMLQARLREIDN